MSHPQSKGEVGYGDSGSPLGGFLYPPPTPSHMVVGYGTPPPAPHYWMPTAPPGVNSSNGNHHEREIYGGCQPGYGGTFPQYSANIQQGIGHFAPGAGGGFGGDSYGNGSGGGGGHYNGSNRGNHRGNGKGQRNGGGGSDGPRYRNGAGDGAHHGTNNGGGKGKGRSGNDNNNNNNNGKGRKKGSNGSKGNRLGDSGGRANPPFGRPMNSNPNHHHTSFVPNFGDHLPPPSWNGNGNSSGGSGGSFDARYVPQDAYSSPSYPMDSQQRYGSHQRPHQNQDPHRNPLHLHHAMTTTTSMLAPTRAPLPAEDLVRKLKASRSKVERQKLLAEAEGYGPEARELLTPHAYTVIIATAGRDNGWRDALKWLELVRTRNTVPLDVFHFSAAIAACAKGRQWAHALFLLESMAKHGVEVLGAIGEPDCVCFNGAISACARGGHWERALGLLDAMQQAGLQPNLISYSAAISACAKGGSWARALSLLAEMRTAGHEPNVISYSAAMSACDKGGQWAKALALLREMLHLGLAADVVSYNAALSACASGRQWAAALSVLQHMRQEGVNPNVVSFNAVLSACQRSGQWERALMLLDDMRQSGVRPDAGTFHLAIAACAEGSQGRRAYALLHALPRATGTPPDTEAYSSALVANAKEGNLHAALQIWQIMLVSSCSSGGATKFNGGSSNGDGSSSSSGPGKGMGSGRGNSNLQPAPPLTMMEPTLECCQALLNLCAARGQWQPALMVVAHLEKTGRTPEVPMYEAAILACERAGQVSQASALRTRAQQQQQQEDAQHAAAANTAAAAAAAGSTQEAESAQAGAPGSLSFSGTSADSQMTTPRSDPFTLTPLSSSSPSLQMPWANTGSDQSSDATGSSFSSSWTDASSTAAAARTMSTSSLELPKTMEPSTIGQHTSPWTTAPPQEPAIASSSLLGASSPPLGLNLGDGFQSWKSFVSEGGSSFDSGSGDNASGGGGGGGRGTSTHQLSFLKGLSSNSGSGGGSSSNGLDDVSSCGSNSGSSQELKGNHLCGGGRRRGSGLDGNGTLSGFSSPDAEGPDGLWGLLDDGEELDWRVKPQEALDAGATLPFGDWRNAVSAGALNSSPSSPSSSGGSELTAPVHSGANAFAPLPLSGIPAAGPAQNHNLARSTSATSVDSESFQPLNLLPHSVVQSLGRSTSNGSTGSSSSSNFINKAGKESAEPIGWGTSAQPSGNQTPSTSSAPKPLDLSPLSTSSAVLGAEEVEVPPLSGSIGAGLSNDLSGAGELTDYLAALVLTDSANR